MKAPITRATLLLFMAFPLQRVMLGVAAALTTIAVALMLAFAPDVGAQRLAMGSLPLVVLGVFPTIFAAGFLFMAVSASRIFALLPHFRRRMLMALALALVASTAPPAGAIIFGIGGDNALAVIAIALLVITCFTVSWALPFAWLGWAMIAGVLLLQLAEWLAAQAQVTIIDHAAAIAAGAVTVAIWITFAVWYLRTATIPQRPQVLASIFGNARAQQSPRHERYRAARLTPAALETHARRVLHLGSLPLSPLTALLFPAIVTASFAIWMVPLAWLAADKLTLPWQVMCFPIAAAFCANARVATRRARLIWLVAGSRARMFATIERTFWREGSWSLLYFAALSGILAITAARLPWPSSLLVGGLLAANALAACYLGFALIRPLGVLDGILVMLVVGGFVGSVTLLLFAPTAYGAGAALLAGLLGLAAALRMAAQARWRSIDWLRLRYRRVPTQASRSLGQRSLDAAQDSVR